jgi:hypothetical protein
MENNTEELVQARYEEQKFYREDLMRLFNLYCNQVLLPKAMETLAKLASVNHYIEFGTWLTNDTRGIELMIETLMLYKCHGIASPTALKEVIAETAAVLGETIIKVYGGKWAEGEQFGEKEPVVIFGDGTRYVNPTARIENHWKHWGKGNKSILSYWNAIPRLINDVTLPNSWPDLDLDNTIFKSN